jgi:hypothetical protein
MLYGWLFFLLVIIGGKELILIGGKFGGKL